MTLTASGYRKLQKGSEAPDFSLSGLDGMDRSILFELEQDSRQSLGTIAKKLKCSKPTLHYRIQRLLKSGIIKNFITVVDYSKAGYTDYEVWIQLSETSLGKKKEFLEFLLQHPNTRWVGSSGGKYDIAIAILAKDINMFIGIFKGITRRFPGIVKNYIISTVYEFHRYQRAYFQKGEEKAELFTLGKGKQVELDKADIAILSALSKDSRTPLMTLAKGSGVSFNTVRTKIRRLEKERVIMHYSISINSNKLSFKSQDILISLQNMSQEKETQLEEYCLRSPYVSYMHKVIGKWDMYVSFDAYSQEHFQEFLTEFRSRFADVVRDFELMSVMEDKKFDYFPMKS